MKILVFGGSFDPPHAGHLRLLSAGLRAARPDLALVVPAWRSPLKTGHSAGPTERLALAEALVRGLPKRLSAKVRVDAWELARGRVTYAYELVRRLRARHPGASVGLLAGSDALEDLPRWRRPAELKRSAAWLVGRRPGRRRGGRASRPGSGGAARGFTDLRFIPGRFPDLSSTALRARLLSGESPRELLPGTVAREVERRGLYAADARRALERDLKPERWRHSLAVARLARELALRHGFDAERAALAGLLHDCGRRLDFKGLARRALRRDLEVPHRAALVREAPLLLHAFVGADMARREFGVEDREVLAAIRNHTLGAVGMGRFERLLFVADGCSEDRRFDGARRLRRLAFKDLGRAFKTAVENKRRWVRRRDGWLHPGTAAFLKWTRSL